MQNLTNSETDRVDRGLKHYTHVSNADFTIYQQGMHYVGISLYHAHPYNIKILYLKPRHKGISVSSTIL
jgi:hypothetical protein